MHSSNLKIVIWNPHCVASWKYCDLSWTPTIPTVIDALNSSCTNQALSAKQWCVLNSKIATLEARGRFLSNWNATTWLPVSFPEALLILIELEITLM